MDLKKLKNWVDEGNRSVKIEYKSGDKLFSAWVFDYDLLIGQHIKSVDEINLERKKIERAKRDLKEAEKILDNA